MQVKDLVRDFKGHRKPMVAAAAFLGVHPQTIRVWKQKGSIPDQWVALYRAKRRGDMTE